MQRNYRDRLIYRARDEGGWGGGCVAKIFNAEPDIDNGPGHFS